MEVRHYYYTSYADGRTGKAGFQIKAMSPGISSEQQRMLARMIDYRIPPSLDVRALTTHPVALRYQYHGPNACLLLSICSSGHDEYGRPGNFFAHALVVAEEAFSGSPPIFAWKSPFWRCSDGEERDDVVSLPVLPSLDIKPAFNLDDLWDFLAQGKRRDLLYSLLCAVVHSGKTQRRIVILDSADHIACWIAAVSCLLPPAYRPLLTFATYHHDPYQAHYLITGITSDSSPRVMDEQSFVVINTQTSTCSAVEPSVYAKLAAQAACPDLYEAMMLPVFDMASRRFPAPYAIDEYLEQIALYAGLQEPCYHHPLTGDEGPLTEDEGAALALALSSFVQLPEYTLEDRRELRTIEYVLRLSLRTQLTPPTPLVRKLYQELLALLEAGQIAIEQALIKEIIIYTKWFTIRDMHNITALDIDVLYQIYGKERIDAARNSEHYVNWLAEHMETMTRKQLLALWQWMGNILWPGPHTLKLVIVSLRVAIELSKREEMWQIHDLLQTIALAMQAQALTWLQLLGEQRDMLPGDAFPDILALLYYRIIERLSLAERQPYRQVMLPICREILNYEIREDVLKAGPGERVATLERWVRYAWEQQLPVPALLKAGVASLRQQCETAQEWRAYVIAILNSEQLEPLPLSIEEELVALACASPSLTPCTPEEFAIYIKYRHHHILTSQQQSAIEGLLALTCGKIEPVQTQYLHQAVERLSLEQYRAVIEYHIPQFLQHMVSDNSHDSHRRLIQALFPRSVELETTGSFWLVYQKTLITLLARSEHIHTAVGMLDFWFTALPCFFTSGYPIQQFFLSLSYYKLVQSHSWPRKAADLLNTAAATRSWYASIQSLFVEEPSLLGILSQRMSSFKEIYIQRKPSRLKKRIGGHENRAMQGQTRAERTAEDEISDLFAGPDIAAQHRLCTQLHTMLSPARFWSLYWQHFLRLLTSDDAERILAVFDFWFDQSYTCLATSQFLPQEFFLGVHSALESAASIPGFRETTRALEERMSQGHKGAHPWYSVVAHYFRRS